MNNCFHKKLLDLARGVSDASFEIEELDEDYTFGEQTTIKHYLREARWHLEQALPVSAHIEVSGQEEDKKNE